MERWNTCLAGIAHGNPLLEAHVQSTIVGRAGFSPKWRPVVLEHCADLLDKMSKKALPDDGRSDLVFARGYLEQSRDALSGWGAKSFEPGFLQNPDREATDEEFVRWPSYYLRNELIEHEFLGHTVAVLETLDDLVGLPVCPAGLPRARSTLRPRTCGVLPATATRSSASWPMRISLLSAAGWEIPKPNAGSSMRSRVGARRIP